MEKKIRYRDGLQFINCRAYLQQNPRYFLRGLYGMGALKGSGSDSVENGRADHHHLTEPPHKVCSLLATLNISKLEVNRARNKLSTLKFELRKEYHIDRCSVLVQCTVKGPNFLSEYGKIVAKSGLPIEPAAAS